MRVGLVYDLFEHFEWRTGDPEDADAELEPEETVLALEEALRLLGHDPVRLGPVKPLLANLHTMNVDVAMSIAEMGRSRNREAYALVLFELVDVPFIGSDALTLSVSVDKAWTKDLVEYVGVPCPRHVVYPLGAPVLPEKWPTDGYPMIVKPRYAGTAMGITPAAKVQDGAALARQIQHVHTQYHQDALAEQFIEGSEFTVAVIGHPPEALPVLQRATESTTGIGLHALERKGVAQQDWSYDVASVLTPGLEAEMQRLAVLVYEKLEVRDYARIDFRVDREGRPWFLEINTLPTFAPDGTFAILAELMGQTYPEFLSGVLDKALRRINGAA